MEKTAYDRATVDYNRADQQYTRLQFQVDTKAEQGENRRLILQWNVEMARGNVSVAQQGVLGRGVACFFTRRSCLGSAVYGLTQQVARAKATLRAQEARLQYFENAYNQQMTRLSQRIAQQEMALNQKKSVLDTNEAAYELCMSQ
jgi:hypothetical protein